MRKPLIHAAVLAWMVVLFPLYFPVLLVWPTRRWRLRVAVAYARAWARGFFVLSRVRVRVEGREHLRSRPAVFLFNHTNELDFFANATLAPPYTLVYGKRELLRVPCLGWMWFLGGHPMIKRQDRDQWQSVLDETTALVRDQQFATMLAPEGTRTRDGRLRPFKKGPFHIALTARAPLVPIVIENAAELMGPRGAGPGELRLRVLPPVETEGWDPERIDEHIAEVRRQYLDALGQVEEPAAP